MSDSPSKSLNMNDVVWVNPDDDNVFTVGDIFDSIYLKQMVEELISNIDENRTSAINKFIENVKDEYQ